MSNLATELSLLSKGGFGAGRVGSEKTGFFDVVQITDIWSEMQPALVHSIGDTYVRSRWSTPDYGWWAVETSGDRTMVWKLDSAEEARHMHHRREQGFAEDVLQGVTPLEIVRRFQDFMLRYEDIKSEGRQWVSKTYYEAHYVVGRARLNSEKRYLNRLIQARVQEVTGSGL